MLVMVWLTSSQFVMDMLSHPVLNTFHLLVEISHHLPSNRSEIVERNSKLEMHPKLQLKSKRSTDMSLKTLTRNLQSMTRNQRLMERLFSLLNLRDLYTRQSMETWSILMLVMRDSWVQRCSSIQNSFIKIGENLLVKLLMILFRNAPWSTEPNSIITSFYLEEVPCLMDLMRDCRNKCKELLTRD